MFKLDLRTCSIGSKMTFAEQLGYRYLDLVVITRTNEKIFPTQVLLYVVRRFVNDLQVSLHPPVAEERWGRGEIHPR